MPRMKQTPRVPRPICPAVTKKGTPCTARCTEGGDRCGRHGPKCDPKTCGICLDDYKSRGKKLGCGHEFHPKCIKGWFDQCDRDCNPRTCPTCRFEVAPSSRAPALAAPGTWEALYEPPTPRPTIRPVVDSDSDSDDEIMMYRPRQYAPRPQQTVMTHPMPPLSQRVGSRMLLDTLISNYINTHGDIPTQMVVDITRIMYSL